MQRSPRAKVWEAVGKRNPAMRATKADPLVIDIDASLVNVHSEKELSAGSCKGGYGFAPMIAMVDYCKGNCTGDILAVMMRPDN